MRKEGEDETDGKTVLVAGKVSKQTYRDVETFREARCLSRSQVVADAINHYIHSKECINCGCLNHPDGKKCSVCGADLFSDEEITAMLWLVGIFSDDTLKGNNPEFSGLKNSEYADAINKYVKAGYSIEPSGEIVRDSIGGTKYLINMKLKTKEGFVFIPEDMAVLSVDKNTVYELLHKNGGQFCIDLKRKMDESLSE